MKNKIFIKLIGILLIFTIAVNLAGCTMPVRADDLMDGVTPNKVVPKSDVTKENEIVTDFALRLFKETAEQGENTLISPLSVLCALAMTANGAAGQTREQMEAVLGMSVEELNLYLYTYANALPQGEKYKLNIANSIWFTDDSRFNVSPAFLQTNADYYGADIYKTPFNNQTLRDINNWVKRETDGMIPKVLEEIPKDAIMYLVNTVAFEAEWARVYEKYQVRDGVFTKEDGTKQDVELMYSSEGTYLEDGMASGFVKYYKGSKYAFAALLPNEGVTLSEYIDSLDGVKLSSVLNNACRETVKTAIPKFESEFDIELSSVLSKMGMPDAFDWKWADFSALGESADGNIFISNVIHKTYIEVGEKGTKAGAVTVVAMNDGSAGPPEEPKVVYLDRPFVYMLIDTENNIPFFIGAVNEIE